MPCSVQIKDNIIKEINEMSGNYTNKTPSFIKILQNTINNRFKVPVVTFLKQTDDTFLSKIHIPQSLIDEYYKNELLIEGERDAYEKEKKSLKKGVLELFDSNSELSKIGTPEQYSEYLDTIFPDSKVKDIVYHGTEQSFEEFNKEIISHGRTKGDGIYFTNNKQAAERFAGISDLDRQMLTSEEISRYIKPAIVNSTKQIEDNEIVVQPEQIHILGSKQDIEGVKEFINNKNYNNKNTSDSIFNEYGVTHEEWNNASESEREMIIWQSKNNC